MEDLLKQPLLWEVSGWIALVFTAGLVSLGDFRLRLPRWYQLGVLIALLGLLINSRLLLLFFNQEINPDESQLLSQAITLFHYPVYWRSTDGATMGVLSSYLTSLPAYAGYRLDYISLRFTALLCLLLTVGCGYYTIENFFTPHVARLASLHVVAFLSFTYNHDFLHATNEQLSLTFIGLAFWQYSRFWRRRAFNSVSGLFGLSFTCSLVPFAKLQGTPIALVLILTALVGLYSQKNKHPITKFRRALLGVLAGGITFPILVILLTYQYGVLSDFIQFYVISNLSYSAGDSFWVYLSRFPLFIFRTTDFLFFLIPTFILFIVWFFQRPDINARSREILFLITVALLSSVYAIVKPGNEFVHYLLYLVFPVSLLNAWFLNQLNRPIHTVAWVVLVLALAGTEISSQREFVIRDPGYSYRSRPFQLRQLRPSPVKDTVQKYARLGDCLVVWGWAPRYNVELQMPQGVCDNHTIRCILGSRQVQLIHRARYIRNIETSCPVVFMDAVGPNSVWLKDRTKQGHENFPELKKFVNRYYQFIGEIDSTQIYVRTDRYKALISEAKADVRSYY